MLFCGTETAGDYSYWDHVDFGVETAAKHEIFVVMLPTWGDKFNLCWGKGPVIFHEENAYRYGQWIANRYKEHWNIIWMLGGDRKLEADHRRIIDAMAAGIRLVDKHHLITFHPPGAQDSTDFLLDAKYIDFHTAQTGHTTDRCYQIEEVMQKMADASEKPYLDSEPRYEDHPACFDASIGYFWDVADVRQNAYWSVLAGTKCVKGLWFNPRTGEEAAFGIFRPGEKTLVVPPSSGKGQDWVLEAVVG